jgi:large subunit ribosomal protein L30
MADLSITLKKSTIGSKPKHKLTVQALGLRKLNQTVVKKDNPAIRGMVESVRHLVTVTEVV